MRMDEQTKEIRQILLGRFQKEKDGSLSEVPAGSHWRMGGFQGLSAGWGAVHFWVLLTGNRLVRFHLACRRRSWMKP